MSKTAAPITITATEARSIAMRAQGLAEDMAPFGRGKAAALKAVQHLGYVQIDTIHVLQRAHHHVIWSRVPDYKPETLQELQSTDRAVFEYWNHASSILPTRDYRYSLPLMEKYRSETHWADESAELRSAIQRVYAEIRGKGPLRIGEVESKGSYASGWNNSGVGKIERIALHELWMQGLIMIRSRKGMEKIFDLTERVLPAGTDTRLPSPSEAAEFHVRRALAALGVARVQELHYLQDTARAEDGRAALRAMVEKREAVRISIPDVKAPLYALRSSLDLFSPIQRHAVRFLSPFDNLVIQRNRLKWLFEFDYAVEIYVPAAKRKYGYFVLPIQWGDRLIGRMDAKADRSESCLLIQNLVFEPSFKQLGSIKEPLREALDAFASFQGCAQWKIGRVSPKRFGLK
jgi:uncharacterized protein